MLVVRLEDGFLRVNRCRSEKKVLKYTFSECGIRYSEFFSDGSAEVKSTLGLTPKLLYESKNTNFLKFDSKLSVLAQVKEPMTSECNNEASQLV